MRFLGILTLIGGCALIAAATPSNSSVPRVELRRVPDGGIQPQTVVGRDGTVHLIYFKGEAGEGNIFYSYSKDGLTFSKPIRVNSIEGTAVAIGNIRGGRLALGRQGRVYVAWNGSGKLGDPAKGRTPMLFARLNDAGTAFEPERNIIQTAYGLDGGGGIAADRQGHVYVFWHAPVPGHRGEEWRRVWMARSNDDGKTFEPERMVWDRPTGACGCCSLNAYADPSGKLYVLFRSAKQMVHRDIYLLESSNHGSSFTGADISKWNVGYCVMSSEAFASSPKTTLAAWETEKRVHFGFVTPNPTKITDLTISDNGKNEKYPALAANGKGLFLVSWTEGMGWKHGGSLRWRLIDAKGQRIGTEGDADGVPAWSFTSTYPLTNGDFVILY
jgi:hypothetical protein